VKLAEVMIRFTVHRWNHLCVFLTSFLLLVGSCCSSRFTSAIRFVSYFVAGYGWHEDLEKTYCRKLEGEHDDLLR